MTPQLVQAISVLMFIAALFAGLCGLRLLLRAALFLSYFATALVAAPGLRARALEAPARPLDHNLPALG
jgi:hypothetical protein